MSDIDNLDFDEMYQYGIDKDEAELEIQFPYLKECLIYSDSETVTNLEKGESKSIIIIIETFKIFIKKLYIFKDLFFFLKILFFILFNYFFILISF